MDTRTVNPLLEASDLPFGAPRFDRIREADFRPAIEEAMSRQLAEVEAIVSAPEAPTFENTIVALERCGQDLGRAASVFYNLTGSATNDELQAIKADLAPKLAEHRDAISLNEGLFARIKDLYDRRDQLGLDPVDARLLEKYHTRFVRAGALLEHAAQLGASEPSTNPARSLVSTRGSRSGSSPARACRASTVNAVTTPRRESASTAWSGWSP